MKRSGKLGLVLLAALLVLILTLPLWGMGPAVFLDSDRAVISRAVSPDGRHIAQVERLVVGGVPNIVVIVRRSWLPDWYLAGCAATSHHGEAQASVRWKSANEITVDHTDNQRFWWFGSAPFRKGNCGNLRVSFSRHAP